MFARAERGELLRYVAIGGSITQASGDGWAGEWLRERFPKSDVITVNSGMLLDARLVPLQGYTAPGWKTKSSLPFWWNRFFQDVLKAEEPGAVLRIPVRGTAVGVFYAMSEDYGSFLANVDGGIPSRVFTILLTVYLRLVIYAE